MKKRKISALTLAGLLVLSVVGCSNTSPQSDFEHEQALITVQEQNRQLEQKVTELEQKVEQLTTENKGLILENEELKSDKYTIYSRDDNSWEIIKESEISMDRTLSLKERLQGLAETLSKTLFNELTIEVTEIKAVEGKQIACINLVEQAEGEWMQNYFQGSTGAEITKTQLEETFLQRELTGEWIDGIQILYNGETLMTDHVEFGSIIYR